MTASERKALMPHGAQREIANALKLTESYVSQVITGDARPKTPRAHRTVRRIQVAIARKLGRRVGEVFPLETQKEQTTTDREVAVA